MSKTKSKPHNLTVRLTDDSRSKLQALADKLKLPPSTACGLLIEDALSGDTASRLAALELANQKLQDSIEIVNANLCNSTLALLVREGPLDKEQALNWAKKRLKAQVTKDA